MKFDLVIAGVGGQGNILASQVIAQCAMDAGYNVVNTETKGAAQRGGSVLSHVRLADREIFSPVVPLGQADVLLGFEPLEALRYINLLNKNGQYIINTAAVPTILANLKVDVYPSTDEILAEVAGKGLNGYLINATQAAKELGNVLLTNVVMLGAFTAISDVLPAEAVLNKLLSKVDPKYHDADIAAFNRGRDIIQAKQQG
ncbi:indolepyruvate oxidoreductase subunit beta [Sporolituus thermophilus]|uniref:Indolepyruvate ferredoxin oxidoreductase beta subunit n=1 Tax=Sporolituus thermophilus DSM 23256 TaxID=1123285 RepID=A0A1G7LAV7_9FIRM|nr:indolepyruvate oxidoreductase subunit beta [Sporolituus thermophilus]SDF46516.1 indolepyruvate ferredoxin oxidoreductase beta subunit [Sporolituus thermophilus DSM 23256]